LHLTREELAANEEDVGQAPRLVDVTKCLPCLRRSLAPLNVVKLTIHQVDANGGHGLLRAPLVLLDDFGIRIGWWSLLGPVENLPKVRGGQHHLHLELPKVEVLRIELVNDCRALSLKRCHFALKSDLSTHLCAQPNAN